MEYKTDAVLDIQGNAIFNASVRVLTESRQLATVYNASGVQIPNPVGTDKTGEYSVALPNGKYFLEISVNGKVYETKGPVSFFDIKDVEKVFVTVTDFFVASESNSTAMFQRAVDAVQATGKFGAVHIPNGNYVLGTVTLRPGVDIIGAGPNSATLIPLQAGMVMFQCLNASAAGTLVTLRGFTINNVQNFENVIGVRAVYANRIELSRINFYGLKLNWEFDRGGNHRVDDCLSAPSSAQKAGAFLWWSSTDTEYCAFGYLTNYRIEGEAQSPACYFRRAVGLKGSIFATDSGAYTGTCIVLENDCQGITLSGLVAGYNVGCLFTKGGGINRSPIFNTLADFDFDQNQSGQIIHQAGRQNAIRGGSLTTSDIGTATKAVTVSSSDSSQLLMDGVRISGNYSPNGTCVLLSNTSGHKLRNIICDGAYNGLEFDGTVTDTTAFGFDFTTVSTNPVLGNFRQVGNYIKDCKKFSAANLISSPAMPASLVAVTNNFGVSVRIFIFGGAVNVIKINGQNVAFAPASVMLNPGETIAIEYTTAPTWNWSGI